MNSKSLYHYCKLSTAIEYILPYKRLLLNPMQKTNDPRENQSFRFSYENVDSATFFNTSAFNAAISQELRLDAKVLCLSANQESYFGYEFSRLWALYAGNHTGLCVEVDTEMFLDENSFHSNFVCKRISYKPLKISESPDHRKIDMDQVSKVSLRNYVRQVLRPQHLDFFFFTKNEEWESEYEVRCLLFSEKDENEYCTIKNSLKHIYVGADFNEYYLPSVTALAEGTSISRVEYNDIRLTPRPIKF